MVEKYLVIYPSGKLAWAEIDRAPRHGPVYEGRPALDLNNIYRIIGCDCFEQVYTIIPGIVILVDDEGKVKANPQPLNLLASKLYAGFRHGDPIVGPAVVFALRPSDPYGEMDLFPLSASDEAKLSLCLGAVLPDK